MAAICASGDSESIAEALEEFVAAPNIFDAMVERLANPATPGIVRQMISDILHIGQQLGTDWAVA